MVQAIQFQTVKDVLPTFFRGNHACVFQDGKMAGNGWQAAANQGLQFTDAFFTSPQSLHHHQAGRMSQGFEDFRLQDDV